MWKPDVPYSVQGEGSAGVAMTTLAPRARARSEYAVRVLTAIDEVERIAGQWEAILAASACNRAFSSFAWYSAALRCYGGITPYVLVAERGGWPVAILPLVIDAATGTARFATRLSDYNDIVARDEDAGACGVLLDYARSFSGPYRTLFLNFLRPDSNCIRALRAQESDEQIASYFEGKRICPYIDLARNGGDYLSARSRVSRKDLYRRRRAAERAGAVAEVLDPRVFAPRDLLECFLELHGERFGDASPLVSGDGRAFVEMALPLLFATGKTLAVALTLEERIVAIDLCHAGPRSLCSWNGGFTASAAHLSPGTLVIDAGIRAALARGCDEYDMLRGTERYKLSLCDSQRSLANVEESVKSEV